MVAAYEGHAATVALLIDAKADLNLADQVRQKSRRCARFAFSFL
jgi:ankyrin repeat protein